MILPVLSVPETGLIRARFSSAAENYDRYAVHQKQIARILSGITAEISCSRILELGCGTGILSRLLRDIHPEAHLLLTDSAPGMVSVCRTRVHPSSLVRHSIWDFENSLCEQPHDLVVSSCSLQWLRNPADFGHRLHGMVSPGGETAHAIPVKGMLKEFQGSFAKTGIEWPSLNYLTGEEWDRMFIESGFRILESFPGTFPVRYESPSAALKALRGIGASLSTGTDSGQVHHSDLRNALDSYRENYGDSGGMVPATYEVHFVRAERI